MREVFGYDTRMLSKDEIDSQYVRDADSCGAMHEAEGIGIHPLKLAFAYLRQLRELGVKVHPSSPVLGVKTIKGVHHLRTPNGTVRARCGFCHRRLHQQRPAQEPGLKDHADLVQLTGDATADAG